MSLINDALKQAKQAQPPQGLAPAAGPPLHPVAAERRHGSDILLLLLALVILLLAGLLLWEWFFGAHSEFIVRANSFPAAAQVQQPEIKSAAVAPGTAPEQPNVAAPAVVAPTPATSVPTSAAAATAEAVPNAPAPEAVAPAVVVEPPKPALPTYKLQGIFYYAKNPSAVINGKTVFVGSIVGDVQVVAIGRDSATIMTASGQTKVLDLP